MSRHTSVFFVLFPTLFVILAGAYQSHYGSSYHQQESLQSDAQWNSNITDGLFLELEELARIVDIAYCVGTTGISSPFVCASHCSDFPSFELVDTFHSGYLLGNSCGYIALDHASDNNRGRILVVFRGTYSIDDTIIDLTMVPQKYAPYPSYYENDIESLESSPLFNLIPSLQIRSIIRLFSRTFCRQKGRWPDRHMYSNIECTNCTVHKGFWTSYQQIRPRLFSKISSLRKKFPNYRLDLVGHSLGGAVAALAGLDLKLLGYEPIVTTFGEPRVGNTGFRDYMDATFNLRSQNSISHLDMPSSKDHYRRVTHTSDPMPLLPPQDFGYRPHAGEVFISKRDLPVVIQDVRHCFGDDDLNCIEERGNNGVWTDLPEMSKIRASIKESLNARGGELKKRDRIRIHPPHIWRPFLAHRDYFWRLGLCVPGGDPTSQERDEV
ncbi:Lipase A [Golovinomyces cichoracearum]|uniref:Lipase A n=1 Tax=Golovinomyces cichoracearum TaxID=62708 RepID=A0A420H860_9PEZI|nr:Lipase A [Golovinomyces cichoracearum]